MRLGVLNRPHQIVGQVGIKIKTTITRGKESNPLYIENMSQSRWKDQFCKQNNLTNLPILFLSLKLNMLQKNKVSILKDHRTVLKAKLLKDLDLFT